MIFDRAEATFLRALELKPENQKTHFYLGNIYEKKRQYYNAIFQYRKAGANIMVKRVQEKIDSERPSERREGEDFSVPTPATLTLRASEYRHRATRTKPRPTSKSERITVDHIDRRRFLSALQQGTSLSTRPDVAEVRAEPDPGDVGYLFFFRSRLGYTRDPDGRGSGPGRNVGHTINQDRSDGRRPSSGLRNR